MAFDTMITSLRHHLRPQKPATKGKCHLLEAATEIRFMIYDCIAPDGYLLAAPYTDYMGLFLSCKQIQYEMSSEALRSKTGHVKKMQAIAESTPRFRFQPMCPENVAELMNITIGIPRWTLFSMTVKRDLYTALSQLLPLHFSRVSIEIDNYDGQEYVDTMLSKLKPIEFARWSYAFNATPRVSAADSIYYYDTHTTYRDIVDIATSINCILVPKLCTDSGGHHPDNAWCLRAATAASYAFHLPHPSPGSPSPNARVVAFRFKRFHPEHSCACGQLPHLEYPVRSRRQRWTPAKEDKYLRRAGWSVTWVNATGTTRPFSRQEPAAFLWKKVAVEKQG